MIKICMYSKNISIKLVLSLKLSSLWFIWIALYLHSIYGNQSFPQMRNPMSLTTKYHPGQTDKGGHTNTFDKALSMKQAEGDRSRTKGY